MAIFLVVDSNWAGEQAFSVIPAGGTDEGGDESGAL